MLSNGQAFKPTQLVGITFDAYLTFWLVQADGRYPELSAKAADAIAQKDDEAAGD